MYDVDGSSHVVFAILEVVVERHQAQGLSCEKVSGLYLEDGGFSLVWFLWFYQLIVYVSMCQL